MKDPLCEYAYNWTPYRYGFNNPIAYIDPDGLFESRKEARQYKKENDLKGRVKKSNDGVFTINDKKSHSSTWKEADGTITTGALASAKDKSKREESWKQGGITMSGGHDYPGVEGRDAPYIGDVSTIPGTGMGSPAAHSRGITFLRGMANSFKKWVDSFVSDEKIKKTTTGTGEETNANGITTKERVILMTTELKKKGERRVNIHGDIAEPGDTTRHDITYYSDKSNPDSTVVNRGGSVYTVKY